MWSVVTDPVRWLRRCAARHHRYSRRITAGAMVISIPIGLMCAVYLVEYSNRGKLATTVSLLVDVMSGIPSIVAGLFAFSMFTILLGPGTINGFEGSVALSC